MSSIDVILIVLVCLLAAVFAAFVVFYSLLMARKLKQNKVDLQNNKDISANLSETITTQMLVNQMVNYAFELQIENVMLKRSVPSKDHDDLHIMSHKDYGADYIVANINSTSDRMKYVA